jgi:hypothetical protein
MVRSPKFTWAPYAQLHALAETPQSPPLPPHLGPYTMALFVSQDRRHLFVTTWILPYCVEYKDDLDGVFHFHHPFPVLSVYGLVLSSNLGKFLLPILKDAEVLRVTMSSELASLLRIRDVYLGFGFFHPLSNKKEAGKK